MCRSGRLWSKNAQKRSSPLTEVSERAVEAGEANGWEFLEGVLPDADDFPSWPADVDDTWTICQLSMCRSGRLWSKNAQKRSGPLTEVSERAAEAGEANGWGFLEGVLPDADDFPSLPAELAGDAFIAGHVILAFVDALAAGK